MQKTLDIDCGDYAVKADVYEGSGNGPLVLMLIGRTSNRKKPHYQQFASKIAAELSATTVLFDYSGHGDSPLEFNDISPAQHFDEVVTVFDWAKKQYPGRKTVVVGSSYGGFLAANLAQSRPFDLLVLRAPAIHPPENFNTKASDEDRTATDKLRVNQQALSVHPLLVGASKFQGKTLLVVHGNDERIPPQTTDAYAKAFSADVATIKDLPHSLDGVEQPVIDSYFDQIFNWLRQNP